MAVSEDLRRAAVSGEGMVKMLDLAEWREVSPCAPLCAIKDKLQAGEGTVKMLDLAEWREVQRAAGEGAREGERSKRGGGAGRGVGGREMGGGGGQGWRQGGSKGARNEEGESKSRLVLGPVERARESWGTGGE